MAGKPKEANGSVEPSADDGLIGVRQLPAHVWSRLRAWRARMRASSLRPGQRAPWHGIGSGFRRTLSVAAVLFVLVYPLKLALDWVDPFGLLSASKQQSENFSAQLAAPFYGAGSTAQDHIAVVLIDKGTLEARGIAWPPRYDYYEEVVRRIARQKPRAVYIDLLVNRERKFDDSLDDARQALAEDLRDARFPVYFGTDKPGHPTLFSGIDGVGELVTVWQGVDYPLTLSPAQQLDAPDDADTSCDASPENRSVALGLYRSACPSGGATGCREPATQMSPAQACREIAVQWGQRHPAGNAQLRGLDQQACLAQPGQTFDKPGRVWRWLWAGIAGKLVPRAAADPRERCPYTLTVHEEQLDDPEIAALLADRVVLVGANLVGLNDLASNPVNGQIPGVYVHAMALDNLMTWGHRHLSPVRHAWLASLVLAILTSLLVAIVLRHARHLGWALALAGLAVAFGPILVMHGWLRHPPVDWIGSLAVFAWVAFHVRDVVGRPCAPNAEAGEPPQVPAPTAKPPIPAKPAPLASGDPS